MYVDEIEKEKRRRHEISNCPAWSTAQYTDTHTSTRLCPDPNNDK